MYEQIKRHGIWISIVILMSILFLIVSFDIDQRYYVLLSFLVIILAIFPKFIQFERKSIDSGEMVLVAILSAVASVARVPFAALPSVQPSSAIIIMTAFVFGGDTGFLTGAITALVSNMLLGQGPWTPWQMFAWGMMGMSAGLISKNRFFQNHKIFICIFAFIWGYLYGWIMNLWHILGFVSPITFKSFLIVYSASFYLDTVHAVTNFLIVFFFMTPFKKKLGRIKNKYGIN